MRIKPWYVTYMKSEAHYVNIYDSAGSVVVVRNNLKTLEWQLRAYRFLRIHSRYLININHVEEYSKRKISMKSGEELPVSASYARQTTKTIMDYMMTGEL